MRRVLSILTAAAALATVAACRPSEARPPMLRQISRSYYFEITPDDAPPHARQDIHYRIVINDRKTRQPIENGEGQIFASNGAGANPWDGLTYGPELGTYRGKLSFVVAGNWAMAVRFRRDSIAPLERVDWMQDVLDERPSPTP